MALTRAQRRRRSALVVVLVAFVLLLVVFARDVNRSAHQASGPRRSENKSFAALANVLVTQENQFDQRLGYLLGNGAGLSRVDFAARLTQLDDQLPLWLEEADHLTVPALKHHVNTTLATLTSERVDDLQAIVSRVAALLQLPWRTSTPPEPGLDASRAQASLVATTAEWNVARWSLAKEPAHKVLPAVSDAVGSIDLATALDVLERSPSLAVTRGIGITAVLVNPASLPAPSGELLFPPAREIRLGITVTNASYVVQPVSMTFILQQVNGAKTMQTQTLSTTLGPLGSFAFVPHFVATTAGERATLSIALAGAPAGAHMSLSRHYLVIVAPSGN